MVAGGLIDHKLGQPRHYLYCRTAVIIRDNVLFVFTPPGAGFMKPGVLLKLDLLTSACMEQKMHSLVRRSSFSKAQGLHESGSRLSRYNFALAYIR